MQKINTVTVFVFLLFASCNKSVDQERVENVFFLSNGNNRYFIDKQSNFVVALQYKGRGWPDGSGVFPERIEVLDSDQRIVKIERSKNEIVTVLVDGKQVRKPLTNEQFAALLRKLK